VDDFKIDKTKLKDVLKKELSRKDFLSVTAIAIISFIGIGGVIKEILSHAEGPYTSGDPASGSLAGGAKSISSSTALASEEVEFPASTTTSSLVPDAPTSLGVSNYSLMFHDEFDTGSLNTAIWGIVNGATDNGTTMKSSNVAMGANGLELINTGSSGALVTSGTWLGGVSGSGFTCNPSGGGTMGSSGPIYIEWQSYVPPDPQDTSLIAYWPALWTVGQNWSEDGEIDVMEGLGGTNRGDIHYGANNSDAVYNYNSAQSGPGTHTYGLLWTTSGQQVVIDGILQPNGTNISTAEMDNAPQCILLENGGQSPGSGTLTMTVRYVRVWQG
jgi:hypothetical protein